MAGSGLTRDGLSRSVLLRAEEPAGTKREQRKDGIPTKRPVDTLSIHCWAQECTHTCKALTWPIPPSPVEHTRLVDADGALGQDQAGGTHSWMMGASCVPRSLQ